MCGCPTALPRALALEVGPIATTSANRHGEASPHTAAEAAAALDGEPSLVLDGGPCAAGPRRWSTARRRAHHPARGTAHRAELGLS